jgi:hypothetical protein
MLNRITKRVYCSLIICRWAILSPKTIIDWGNQRLPIGSLESGQGTVSLKRFGVGSATINDTLLQIHCALRIYQFLSLSLRIHSTTYADPSEQIPILPLLIILIAYTIT